MAGDISLADEKGSQVTIEGAVSVYRDPDRDDEVLQTALAPAPEDRYTRAVYMADALDGLVEE